MGERVVDHVVMYTDGACKGNPGPGGWGVWLRSGSSEKDLYGGELNTTNNRMELMAVIRGLEALNRPCTVDVYLDSVYVRKGITEWIRAWKAKGWKTSAKQPVKNADLWRELDDLVEGGPHTIEWHWVKGHSGDEGNERADLNANRGVDRRRPGLTPERLFHVKQARRPATVPRETAAMRRDQRTRRRGVVGGPSGRAPRLTGHGDDRWVLAPSPGPERTTMGAERHIEWRTETWRRSGAHSVEASER